MTASALDFVLAGGLVALGAVLLFSHDLFRSLVLFVVYGLLMAVVWVRLGAPDLALAEAAVGAGVTGALMLAAWHRLPAAGRRAEGVVSGPWVLLSGVALAGVAAALIGVLAGLDAQREGGLQQQVLARLPESGVESPVTAVLLNFRGYDTFLELGVLLLAALLVRLGGGADFGLGAKSSSVLRGLADWLAPLLVLTAGYLLWRGGHAPGGAFQAGALLAGAGILLALVYPPGADGRPAGGPRAFARWTQGLRLRGLLSAGFLVFLGVALALLVGGNLLQYPAGWAGALILLIEAAAALSIGAALLVLFMGVAGGREAGAP